MKQNFFAWVATAILIGTVFSVSPGPVFAASPLEIVGVRLGVHPDKTRVVIDLKNSASYQAQVGGDGKSVIVDLPPTHWTSQNKAAHLADGLVSKVSYSRDNDGSAFVIGATQGISIQRAFALAPKDSYGHRVVIDLVPSNRTQEDETEAIEETITQAMLENDDTLQIQPASSGPPPGVAPEQEVLKTTTPGFVQTSMKQERQYRPLDYDKYFGDRGQLSQETLSGDAPPRFFIGGSYGMTWLDSGISNLTGSAQLDEEDFGYKAFGGINFNQYLGAELFYANLGDAALSGNAGDRFQYQGTTYEFITNATVTRTTTTFGLAAVAGFDVRSRFRPFVKVGLHRWNDETSAESSTTSASIDESGLDLFYGAGLSFRATDLITLRGEYEYFQGEDDRAASLLSMGAQINF